MSLSTAKLYRYHVKNLHAVDSAFSHNKRLAHEAIARNELGTLKSLTSIQTLLLGVYGEARLSKLLYELSGFSPDERIAVKQGGALIERWSKAIDIAFCKHYAVLMPALTTSLPFTARARYLELRRMLETDLAPAFELRNKIAHGQWEWPFVSNKDELSMKHIQQLKTENMLKLQFKRRLIGALADLIHDLVISVATFERDFDARYKHIEDIRRDITTRSYTKWSTQLIEKYKKGQNLRSAQSSMKEENHRYGWLRRLFGIRAS